MIYHNGKFYDRFEDVLEYLQDVDELHFDEDYIIEYQDCVLEKMFTFDPNDIVERFAYDRDDEDGDTSSKAIDIITKYCDIDKINKEMPELWYPQRPWKTFDLRQLIKEADNG